MKAKNKDILENIIKGTKILESIENYSLINTQLESKKTNLSYERNDEINFRNHFRSDSHFWNTVMYHKKEYWNKTISLRGFAICDWVARVPGLFWTESSFNFRKAAKKNILIQEEDWTEYDPLGKSKRVIGGVGTIHLPPNDEGKRLISVSSSCNASLGIPILIFPDVIDCHHLKQGDVVNVLDAKWQAYDVSWAKKFESTKDVPRGYLVIDHPSKIEVVRRQGVLVAYHPYSVMEYEFGDALLYDFVYRSAHNKMNNVEQELETFFANYALDYGRNGNYIINPDMVEPIFETMYNSPNEMKDASEKAKIELLYSRVREITFNDSTLDELIKLVPQYYQDSQSIRGLARRVGIKNSVLKEDNAASMSAQLINYCLKRSKIEDLTDRMMVEYPKIFV